MPFANNIIRSLLLCALLASPGFAAAQTPAIEPQPAQNPAVSTVTFTFDWPSVQPNHYSIAVDSTGNAAYESHVAEGAAHQSLPAEPYMVKFTVSEATRERVFELARQANYFNGDFEFKKHRIAHTGAKTLAYADAGRSYRTTYNWSQNPAIDQLTSLFENISNTQEAARRLQQLRRFDKLGLDEELKNMEILARGHRLAEVQSIAPLLEKLASDTGIMNIARERARRLLQMARQEAEIPTTSSTSAAGVASK